MKENPAIVCFYRRDTSSYFTTEIIVTTENLSRRAKYLQTLLSQFWSRWRREYLSELREAHSHVARSYKSTGERFIRQDDIVLIREDRVP